MPEMRQAVELEPDKAEYHYGLAWTLLHLGRIDESVAEFETAAKLDPDYEEEYQAVMSVLLNAALESR